MMKQGKSKFGAWLCAALVCALLLAASMGFAACGGVKDLRIDVPSRIEADIGTGTYVVPRYDVVDPHGLIMAGYSVRLKSATDPNGDAAEISREASTIVTLTGAGEYTFVYTADNKHVPDATVIMDFADRTAPTIQLSSSQFPSFFIKGNTYAVPEYTLAGDYLASKCYTKVYYNAGTEGATDEDVTLDNGNFAVTHEAGKYTVHIHVEDAAGNGNDYRYVRSVYSPEHYEEDIVIYFNEKFAERQVAADGNYAGKYVSKADGGKAYGDEAGSYKVEFTGDETNNNEAYFALNVPAITNIMDNKELEMYVYIDDADCENEAKKWVVGSKWWNDQQVEVGKWQRVTWPIDTWGNGTGANSGATTSQVISADNISGTRIRLIPDAQYEKTPAPHGTVYFSAMRLIPHEWAEITSENGVVAPKRAYVGQTLTLTEPQAPAGQTFDCFTVNGKPVSGDTLVIGEKGAVTIGAKFVDGELNKTNFTWGEADYVQPTGSDAQKAKLGEGKYWALEYEAYGIESGWVYAAAYVGGTHQLIGFELNGQNDKLSSYGGAWKTPNVIDLTAAQSKILRDATQENPAKVAYVRTDDKIVVLLNGKFAGVFSFASLEISGDDFGLGARAGTIKNATVKNIKYVVGETRTAFAQAQYNMAVTVSASEGAHADKTDCLLGDTVTLTHDAPSEEGKEFAYYTVNDERISGSAFVAAQSEYTVKAVYADVCMLTLGEGVALADGSTGTVKVAQNSELQLKFVGTSPSGKYFVGFKADDTPIEGSTFTPTASTHTVTAVFANRVDSGNIMLNDISKAATSDGWISKQDYTPNKVEYVTDKKYDGIDGAVSESGLIKVTVKAGENAFALTEDLSALFASDYKEIYFYVYAENSAADIGGWWCRKPTKVGEWVKITLTRSDAPQNLDKKSVWTEGFTQFIYSVRGDGAEKLKEGDVFYFTGLFGVPYKDVPVTVNDGVKTYVSVSAPVNGKTYKENETVTLTHSGAPANQEFLRFTVKVDGGTVEAVTGSTYTVPEGATAVEFGAEFADISTLTVAEGIRVNGQDVRTLTVARGATVTLEYIGTPAQGTFFDCFKDGGAVINGNSFIASGETHSITAAFATNATDMTWATATEADMTQSEVYSQATAYKTGVTESSWVLEYTVETNISSSAAGWIGAFVGDNYYVEFEIAGWGQYLHAHIPSTDSWTANTNLTDAQKTLFANAATTPVKLKFVRQGRKLSVLINEECFSVYDLGENFGAQEFGIEYRNGTKNVAKNIRFVAGEEKTNAYVASVSITVTLADGITANGQSDTLTVINGETVTLAATAPNGQLVDYFTINNAPITGNTFIAAQDCSIGVEFAENLDSVKWFDENNMQTHKFSWSNNGYRFSGKKASGAEAWIAKASVQFTADNAFKESNWYNLSFLVGDNAMLQIRMHTNLSAGGIQIQAMGSALRDGSQLKKLTDEEATSVFDKFKANSAVEFAVVRSQSTYYVYIDDVLVLTTTHDFKIAGNALGVGSCVCDDWMKDCVPYEYTFTVGQDKVDAYMNA